MHGKVVAGDKTVKKKCLINASKNKTLFPETGKEKNYNKYTNRVLSKDYEDKTSATEIRKHSTCQISDSKTTLYKNMKKLLEKKYKTITTNASQEIIATNKSRYTPEEYNLAKVKEKTPFSRKPPKKTSSMSDSNTVDSRSDMKEENYHSNQESLQLESNIETNSPEYNLPKSSQLEEKNNKKEKLQETSIKKITSDDSVMKSKQLSESDDPKLHKSSVKGPGKTKRFKISKRLESLAKHKELPIPVKRDLSFKPFKVPKRALLFRDRSCILKSSKKEKNASQDVKKKGNSNCIINVFDSNRPHFGHYRRKRRLLKTSKPYFPTPRLLELAKPVPKHPPVDILPPEQVFTVKKRSLKAKCSKRISELAFPLIRPEEFRINADIPFGTKRRSLRAKCTKRVRELAKPLPRRCRSPIRKLTNDEEAEM